MTTVNLPPYFVASATAPFHVCVLLSVTCTFSLHLPYAGVVLSSPNAQAEVRLKRGVEHHPGAQGDIKQVIVEAEADLHEDNGAKTPSPMQDTADATSLMDKHQNGSSLAYISVNSLAHGLETHKKEGAEEPLVASLSTNKAPPKPDTWSAALADYLQRSSEFQRRGMASLSSEMASIESGPPWTLNFGKVVLGITGIFWVFILWDVMRNTDEHTLPKQVDHSESTCTKESPWAPKLVDGIIDEHILKCFPDALKPCTGLQLMVRLDVPCGLCWTRDVIEIHSLIALQSDAFAPGSWCSGQLDHEFQYRPDTVLAAAVRNTEESDSFQPVIELLGRTSENTEVVASIDSSMKLKLAGRDYGSLQLSGAGNHVLSTSSGGKVLAFSSRKDCRHLEMMSLPSSELLAVVNLRDRSAGLAYMKGAETVATQVDISAIGSFDVILALLCALAIVYYKPPPPPQQTLISAFGPPRN